MSKMMGCPGCSRMLHESAQSCPHCGAMIRAYSSGSQSRIVAALLAFFLGSFGAHKFYLGKIGMGILYLLFFWTFIPTLISFIEFIIYLCTSDEDFAKKYG
ncbi:MULTISPECIES: NINE protein [Photorhabdus]|uniref:NINE protein n=1 Tax=Photorhabdus kayaii TaxID=230088 RepID=A0ABX0B0U7_9GAMM|nr:MULTISPECIES: NINE protein [Photorhabdus]MCC8373296.1 NINE protein [Photorhabdus bodei]MCT8354230.1 NINE protein [Photorhabdus kayaii]MDB6369178.1 NINE protein [Photorhabdus bodei]NDL12722.1 NINE protein [Photorhabdus kayaii]NDL26259.1 NINE protein [Photorhabdus kayaii]